MAKHNLALLGCGYWGRNYATTLRDLSDVSLDTICDLNLEALGKDFRTKFPTTQFTPDYRDILRNGKVDGAIIATTTSTHFELAKAFLEAGVGVLVEKPLTTSSEECTALCEIAERKGVPLMVGHIFRYNAALMRVKEMVERGDIGVVRYLEATRKGLGPVRKDVSALWDLASHDIYVACHLLGHLPQTVSYSGISHNRSVDDVVSLNMVFPGNVLVTIYANWEHPIKERKLYVGGTKGAVLFDDVEPVNKVVLYDKGVDYQPLSGELSDFVAAVRDGDIHFPNIRNNSPLRDEVTHFLKYLEGEQCRTPGRDGLENVRILETAELSRRNYGLRTELK